MRRHDELLIETLREAQRLGFFGAAPIEQAIAHANEFVVALGDLTGGTRIVDIGSGGGLPGLVIAAAVADPSADPATQVSVTLVDRREKRTDFLRRAVLRLGMEHVVVRTAGVDSIARAVEGGQEDPFDVVTARGFGPPVATLTMARRLVAPGGRILISEPPTGDRWPTAVVDGLGLTRRRLGVVSRFELRSTP